MRSRTNRKHNEMQTFVKGFIGFVIVLMLAMFAGYGYLAYTAIDAVNDAVCVKEAIIAVGKKVKEISAEINQYTPE